MGWGAPWETSRICSLSRRNPACVSYLVLLFPVKTEGAFSSQSREAQAIAGCPFLGELLPDVQGQKAVLCPALVYLRGQGNNGPLPNSACALSGHTAWLKPLIKGRH